VSEGNAAVSVTSGKMVLSFWLRSILFRPIVFGSLIPSVTLMNAAVGMILPQMMDPISFGEYALIATLFNYGLIFDLGMSQMVDRMIPAHLGAGRPDLAQSIGAKLLWVRLWIGVVTLLFSTLALTILASQHDLPFGLVAGLLACLAGVANMVAQGPVNIYRARSDRADYAIRTAILLLGLIVARLGGLKLGGLDGCFAAMAVWYLGCVIVFNHSMAIQWRQWPSVRETSNLLRRGLPFFATSFIWAFFVTGNRWIASFLITGDQFGQFAFGANVFSLLVGAAGGFSAFYYPRITQRITNLGPFSQSRVLTRDFCVLTIGMGVMCGIGILLTAFFVGLIYPKYVPGIESARVILVAVPAMVLAAWIMPVSLSGGSRPWIDGAVIYPLATLILIVSMILLDGRFANMGAAWASTAAAIPLVAMQVMALVHARVLRARNALVILAVGSLVSAALGLLTVCLSR
jgi:O-antigen/teichoic acid export membrane protein